MSCLPRKVAQTGIDFVIGYSGDYPPPLVIEPTAPHTLTYIHHVGIGQRAHSRVVTPRRSPMGVLDIGKNNAVKDDTALTFLRHLAPKLPGVRWILPMPPKRSVAMLDQKLGKGLVAPAWADINGTKISSPQDWRGMCGSVRSLAELVRHEVEERGVSPERIIVSGFSQGGCVALGYAIGQPASFAREFEDELPDVDDPDAVARWVARLESASGRVETSSDAPPWYRVGGVVVWRSFLPCARLLAHRDVGLGFVAPPLDATRARGLPALFVTGSDDNVVSPEATVISSSVVLSIGADVVLKKLKGSLKHGDTRAEWCSAIGPWIAARIVALEEGTVASTAPTAATLPPLIAPRRDLHCRYDHFIFYDII